MSRDMDKQVAEALGLDVCPCHSDYIVCAAIQTRDCGVVSVHTHTHRNGALVADGCQKSPGEHYSTDIAAAIGALEEFCRLKKMRFEIRQLIGGDDVRVYLNYRSDENKSWYGEGDTIPAATCNAIIAAKRSQP